MVAFELLDKWVDEVEEGGMKTGETVATVVKSSWCSKLKLTERTGMPSWCFSDNENAAVKVGRLLDMGSQRCEPHIFGIMVKGIFFHTTDDDQAAGGRTRARKGPRHPAIFHRWEKMRDIGLYYHNRRDRHNHWNDIVIALKVWHLKRGWAESVRESVCGAMWPRRRPA